jgi:hypothetical protein
LETVAIVFDRQHRVSPVALEANRGFMRPRVTDDVGQRLASHLHDIG